MRWPALIFVVLLAALQYPLWFGKGSWQDVHELRARLEKLQADNRKLEQRNADLAAEVKDLKNGFEAMEERARFELNLVKPGEIFVQSPDEHAR
ncbi:MAG: cell division protein FtsB [Candidatus Dactylopiibacterium sp.]|nr:cell division protein FtsB [Candidatus Dactylopiibacterium sp.]